MFHRNVQNGKVEFANKLQNGLETIWKTLTQGAIKQHHGHVPHYKVIPFKAA